MTATDTDNADLMKPAYVPFDTFETFIKSLKDVATVPDHIEKSMMLRMSGGMQNHLSASLKFLGLIGPDNKTRDGLHALVSAYGTEEWAPVLAKLLEQRYAAILGGLNLKTGTASKLRERFKEATKLDGATLDKSMRFLAKALKAAKVEVSPFLFERKRPAKRNAANGKARVEKAATAEQAKGQEDGLSQDRQPEPPAAPPPGTISYPIHFRGGKRTGSLIVPSDLTEEDVAMVELLIPMLRAYAGAGAGSEA